MSSAHQPGLVHEALIYSSDEEFLARLVPFLRDGIANGEPAFAVVTPDKIALLRHALGRDAERITFVDASAHYRRPAHAIAEYRRQLDAELSRSDVELVRVIGEVQFGQSADEHAEWTRYESVLNRGFAGYPTWIVCPYDTRALPERVVTDAFGTHPFVSTGDRRDASRGYVEPEALVRSSGERAGGRRDPLARLTVGTEVDLDALRPIVAGAARAAGLSPTVVDDVTVAVCELVRDGLRHGDGEVVVQVTRDGARLHCEVTERESDRAGLDKRIGPTIARLISEQVELASGAGTHTVRLTFAGASAARQRILDAASELFYQGGIRATGINAIISHSGVAKATFFHHFPAKDDLVLAWLQQPASRWLDRVRTELDAGTEPPAKRLLTFFDLLGKWFAEDDFRGCAFLNAAAETPDAAHPVRRAGRHYLREIRSYLRRTAADAGLPHPARIADQLHMLAQGAIITATVTGSPNTAGVARAAARRVIGASAPPSVGRP